MDSSRSSLCQQDAADLFCMLESSDSQTVEQVKSLIHENLNGSKDVWLLHGLSDYYIAIQSNRALDVLIRVRQPHDKHLLDRMVEYLRKENTRYNSLLLLSHLIHQQPSWLFKITQHRIFQSLLHLLKTEKDPPSLMCSLFSLVSLLPIVPYQIGSFLGDIFEIFSQLASYGIKQNGGIPEVYVLHLKVGVYALFHHLYGMFPCNFLGYLRSHYGGREYKEENIKIFASTIRPMLERVKLHPLLVTACKDSEISQNRWKRFATHDIVSLCASVSLDSAEGTADALCTKTNRTTSLFSSIATQSNDNSLQYPSYSSIGSNISVTIDSNQESIETGANKPLESSGIKQEYGIWTPSYECGLFTPPPTITTPTRLAEQSNEFLDDESLSANASFNNEYAPITDIEVEKTETNAELFNVEKLQLSVDQSVGEAFEAKEEDLDREVSELTSDSEFLTDGENIRIDTPFHCTTQNLTDKTNFQISDKGADNQEDEEDLCTRAEFDDQSDLKMDDFVRTMSRFRYLSQCGLPHETLKTSLKTVSRTSSCPDIYVSSATAINSTEKSMSPKEEDEMKVNNAQKEMAANYPIPNAVWNPSLNEQPIHSVETSYDHLIPLALRPLSLNSEQSHSTVVYRGSEQISYCSLSPTELLDRHIRLGAEAHANQLSLIPLTSTKNTDWTHFGGTPPPDVISMAQTQIQLLHNHVMFERHQREIHAERNRRLLGRAKRSKMEEEYTASLKDRVISLQKENEDMKKEFLRRDNLYLQLEEKKKLAEKGFIISIKKLTQENINLMYSNKKLQGLLVSQRQENDALRQELQCSQAEVLDLQFEVELLNPEIERSRKLDKENQRLAKENVLLQEMNQQYQEKAELSEEPKFQAIEIDLLNDSSTLEIKNLKQTLEKELITTDTLKGCIKNLEDDLADMKKKLKEKTTVIEEWKSIYNDAIMAREERLSELLAINHQHTAHILQLYSKPENSYNIEDTNLQSAKMSGGLCVNTAYPISVTDECNDICPDEPNANVMYSFPLPSLDEQGSSNILPRSDINSDGYHLESL